MLDPYRSRCNLFEECMLSLFSFRLNLYNPSKMSGKPYSMKEMRSIVEYLTENKYYNAIRGRKMWMDFAETSLTSRTWQSLKETFLKRILPDIHNPYYKLSKEQIVSFRQGYDAEVKPRNKLKIQTISDDSSGNDEQRKDKDQPAPSNINAGKTTGEDNKSAKMTNRNRPSAETVILENCYNTAEDIQKVLESSTPPPPQEKKKPKKFKDFITYSEPLAPILQEVINDFATDTESSDREPMMEIDENASFTQNEENVDQKQHIILEDINTENEEQSNLNKPEHDTTSTINNVEPNENQDSEIQLNMPNENISQNDISTEVIDNGDITSEQLINKDKDDGVQGNDTEIFTSKDPTNISTENKDDTTNEKKESENCTNTTDSLLPNNPEALEINKNTQTRNSTDINKTVDDKNVIKPSRKRAISEDNVLLDKKKKNLEQYLDKNTLSAKKFKKLSRHSDNNIEEDVEDVTAEPPSPILNKQTTTSNVTMCKENTTKDKDIKNTGIDSTEKDINARKSPQKENLCLKSVSLFEEQFNESKYNDSDSSDVEMTPQVTESKKEPTTKTQAIDNPVLIKTNSESENLNKAKEKKRNVVSHTIKSQREKALANVFGFSTGAVSSRRKSQLRRKRSHSHRKTITITTDSSEWTSESDTEEYISPPRGRKNSLARKYLKPKSARILSMEEEGGLFVMYGKRIYPLVKDGKLIKNYLTYENDNHSDDFNDEAYWKLKYENEKKKSEELEKLVKQTKEPSVPREKQSPKQQPKGLCQETTENQPCEPITPNMDYNNVNKVHNEVNTSTKKEEKIKIKFTRNNEEVHLEGHWPQIHPVLEQVVNIFHKDTTDHKIVDSKPKLAIEGSSKEISSSGISTPVVLSDHDVRSKVDTIEKEIFQEIEQRAKEEVGDKNEHFEENNITKRYPRRHRNSSTTTITPAKSSKSGTRNDSVKTDEVEARLPEIKPDVGETQEKSDNMLTRRSIITTRSSKNRSINLDENKPMQTRKSKKEESPKVNDDSKSTRYMLPQDKNQKVNTRSSSKTSSR